MDLSEISQKRYTTKHYDKSRKIQDETLQKLLEAVRLSPSSVNSQPWHFVVVRSEEAKNTLADAIGEGYQFNRGKITDSDCSIIFCVKTEMSDDDLQIRLDQEDKDGRFANEELKAGQAKGRAFFVDLHRKTYNDIVPWMEKQLYLALGTALLGAGVLGLDATPIEGFDTLSVDKTFALGDKGIKSVVILSLGYHSEDDFNASLPKSRLPEADIITHL
ncbi:MAG: Oxygen-insensitive NAD(P)H nitroreductase [Candidatus Erwinia impunctatus]|nr:Oxygen-insensitive NAD(P)H nitroreductase [Culicoides impunctatus]